MSVLLNFLVPWKGERRLSGLPSGGESAHEQQLEKFVCLHINPFYFLHPDFNLPRGEETKLLPTAK